MKQMDYLGYRVICLGFLLLTVVIFSGAIWAAPAWSSWWSWDPKETGALITWIFYAIYLHQRLRLKWQGKRMAWLAIIAFILVIFTFAGVNLLLPGLHSYATTYQHAARAALSEPRVFFRMRSTSMNRTGPLTSYMRAKGRSTS